MQQGEVYDIGKLNDNVAYIRHLFRAVPASNASLIFIAGLEKLGFLVNESPCSSK